jgi:cytochrome P450
MSMTESSGAAGGSSFEFNPYTPEFDRDPYSTYAYLREKAPVYYWSSARVWVLSKYEDVERALHDHRYFNKDLRGWKHAPKRAPGEKPNALEELAESMLANVTPQNHLRIRKLGSHAFTPRAIERMRHEVQQIVDEVLAVTRTASHLDVAQGFAALIPMRVMMKTLAIPAEHERLFQQFGGAVIDAFDLWLSPERLAEIDRLVREGCAMLESLVEQRRAKPGNDLLSDLVIAEEQGSRLTRKELIALVALLVAGGTDTTVYATCFAALQLFSRPDVRSLVRGNPPLLRRAMEESMRYDCIFKGGINRVTCEDVVLRGVEVPKGEMLYLLPASAMRDPAVVSQADTFDIQREPSHNLSFGLGLHYCMGAAMARMTLDVAVGTLLERFPRAQLAGPPVFARHGMVRRMASLPLVLES